MIGKSGKLVGPAGGGVVSFASGIADYTSARELLCNWIQIATPNTNSAPVLIGGTEVTALVGFPLPNGYSGQLFPPHGSDPTAFYDLTQQKAYLAAGDVLNILYA